MESNRVPSIVFEGRRFAVEQHTVRDGQGRLQTYELVRHPGAAVVLPLLDDGRVVMIRNRRFGVQRDLLELPAGTLDRDEPPEVCARRELEEETGYQAVHWLPLLSFFSTPGICTERMHAFLASGLRAGATRHEAGERIVVVPMGYDEVLAAIRDGRIEDGKTIVTVLFYERYVRARE